MVVQVANISICSILFAKKIEKQRLVIKTFIDNQYFGKYWRVESIPLSCSFSVFSSSTIIIPGKYLYDLCAKSQIQ